MNVLDLFSGIGGFSLGLERAGMRTVAFCEIEPYCRAVLRKHWPDVPIFDDVRSLHAADVPGVDVICGGFPCQDISLAGKGAGLAGERSGLWSEFHRLISEIRPRYAIIENVSALRSRGLDTVLGSLAEIGYDAEWHCIPASAVGAPHRRDRVWIVAYPGGQQHEGDCAANERAPAAGLFEAVVADAVGERPGEAGQLRRDESTERAARCGADVAYPDQERVHRPGTCGAGWIEPADGGAALADPDGAGRIQQRRAIAIQQELASAECCGWWLIEPDVGRVANGVPSRVDRLRSLGNAVVPQIPEIIGRAIMKVAA